MQVSRQGGDQVAGVTTLPVAALSCPAVCSHSPEELTIVLQQNKAVYIQIRESGAPMFGTLSLRANDDASAVFVVWQPSEESALV